MRQFFFPAEAPFWLRTVLNSIREALSDIWPTPLRLKDYTTAGLPTASDWKQGLAYDSTLPAVKYSDGSSWVRLMVYNAGAALTKADDTNVTMTLGGSPTTALLAATSLTLGWTGTLAVARGGTGAATFTSGYLLKGNGASAVSVSAVYDDGTNIALGTTTTRQRITLGTTTSTGTATPESIDLGATFSNSAGANHKLKLHYDGSNSYGLGVSSGQLDYAVPSGAAHAFHVAGSERARLTASSLLVGVASTANSERLAVVGGNGIFCRTQYSITSTASDIALGAGMVLLLRDNTNGGTALVLYENAGTPIIVSQTGANFVTAAPAGTQIQLANRTGNLGVSAVMASGQSSTLNVAVLSVDDA